MAAKQVKKKTKKENDRLAINALDGIMKEIHQENSVNLVTPSGNLEVKIKKYLDIQSTVSFVNDVIATATVSGVYFPALYDFAFKSNVISYLTNITLPLNADKTNDFIYGTDIYNTLVDQHGLHTVVDRLEDACLTQIQTNINKSKLDDLLDLIMEIVVKYESQLENINLQEVVSKLSNIDKPDEKAIVEAFLNHKENSSVVGFMKE